MDPQAQTPEPTPSQTTEPTEPVAAESTVAAEPAAPATFATEPQPQQEPEAQQTTEPQSPTEQEPTETVEPDARVVPKPSEYELPEGLPDNLRIFAHENGFTQEQLSSAIQQFGGYMTGMKSAERQALSEMGQTHLKNWGENAQTNLNLARQALKQNDPDGTLAKALNESGWGDHPAVLDFLHNIGKSMQEGGFLKSTVPRPSGEKTLAQALYGENHPTEG